MERISGQGGCDCWSRVGDSTGRGQGGDVVLGTNKMKSQGTEFMREIKFCSVWKQHPGPSFLLKPSKSIPVTGEKGKNIAA